MSAPRVDYEVHGRTYTRHRQPDPRIAGAVSTALGDAETVVNVGAGAGSYEPADRWVLAVEPSAVMRAQRPPGAAPAIAGHAESLPFDDDEVDAAMASITIHHWDSPETGLRELARIARRRVVVLTFDLVHLPAWQREHLAEGLKIEEPRFPSLERIASALPGTVQIQALATPADCVDGFFEAFWSRPEALLDPSVRASQSMWPLLPAGVEQQIVNRLAGALSSGEWDAVHGHLRTQESFAGSLRLVVAEFDRAA